MGVIIKYVVELPDLAFKVSNDTLSGKYIVDTAIQIEMTRGIPGTSFQIQLFDLPKKVADSIFQKVGDTHDQQPANLVKLSVKLGYFDQPFGLVMDGIIERVQVQVQGDSLITTLRGLETGTRALHMTPFQTTLDPPIQVDAAITRILSNAKIVGGDFTQPATLDNNLQIALGNRTVRGQHLIDAIGDLAEIAGAELLVVDKKLWVGKPIAVTYPGMGEATRFTPGVNLGTFTPFTNHIPDENDPGLASHLTATTAEGFTFSVTGDPQLRPGHKVTVDNDDFRKGGEYRIHSLVHKFNMTEGYTCSGRAIKVTVDGNGHRRERFAQQPTADSLVEGFNQLAIASRKQRPSVEIGKVKTYSPGNASDNQNTSTLYYGQVFERTESQPSVATDVFDQNDNQLAKDRPIISPFAWHKCGLVVPVWKGMKAMLTHNLSLEDDSLVTGFTWSKRPVITPPRNEPGDWWLCLPVFADDYDGSSPPGDSTKAANDLVSKSGKRVIEVKGLRITVGTDKLGNVGDRPKDADEDALVIDHKKANIKISDSGDIVIVADSSGPKGKVSISNSGDIEIVADDSGKKGKVSISNSGDIKIVADDSGQKGKVSISSSGDIEMTADGSVTMKLTSSGVQIS